MVDCFPDIAGLRCHEVARAVGSFLHLEVVDGKFGNVEHSWLLIQRDKNLPYILDTYSVGRLPTVQLMDPFWGLPHTKWYKAGAPRKDIRENMVSHLRSILIDTGFSNVEACNGVSHA